MYLAPENAAFSCLRIMSDAPNATNWIEVTDVAMMSSSTVVLFMAQMLSGCLFSQQRQRVNQQFFVNRASSPITLITIF